MYWPFRVFALALAVVPTFVVHLPSHADPLRVMTLNIRTATAQDGDDSWPQRRELLMRVIRDYDPDVLGVQEARRSQLDELAEAFPELAKAGVAREAGGGGEYTAVFYREGRFDLASAGTFWLSDQQDVPGSHSWGNRLPRICTWVRLFDRETERRFLVYNTHWDHESQPARRRSGGLMAEEIQRAAANEDPVLVMGDFNCDERDPAMTALTRAGELLRDTFRAIHPNEKNIYTYNGFGKKPGKAKIDGILATPQWRVLDAEIVRTHEGERYPSDHYPVVATVTLHGRQ
jgi:endonuclease/exonuclease/phosphatase family metal-dependent hydrolase